MRYWKIEIGRTETYLGQVPADVYGHTMQSIQQRVWQPKAQEFRKR